MASVWVGKLWSAGPRLGLQTQCSNQLIIQSLQQTRVHVTQQQEGGGGEHVPCGLGGNGLSFWDDCIVLLKAEGSGELFTRVSWVALGLHCCRRAFSSCRARDSPCSGFSLVAEHRPQVAVAALALSGQPYSTHASAVGACGLVPWHVEPSRTRDGTHVPCTGMWIPIHCITREVWSCLFLIRIFFFFFFFLRTVTTWGRKASSEGERSGLAEGLIRRSKPSEAGPLIGHACSVLTLPSFSHHPNAHCPSLARSHPCSQQGHTPSVAPPHGPLSPGFVGGSFYLNFWSQPGFWGVKLGSQTLPS